MSEYEPKWQSLESHPIPHWFKNAKFGVWFHWGPYSVPAYGSEWYPREMYLEASDVNEHHTDQYGPLPEHGYHEFIPRFNGNAFDAKRWLDLCEEAGAEYVGVTAIHHDGFAMWDSGITDWNAADMGPERDIIGELAAEIRDRDMKFLTAFHHAFRWWYYPRDERFHTMDESYAGLYGEPHEPGEDPPLEYYQQWRDMTLEVIDNYRPDLIYFDFGWGFQPFLEHDKYRRQVVSHYYNRAAEWNKSVDVAHKRHLPPGVGIVDYERSRREELSTAPWMTDTSVDNTSWGYVSGPEYKSVDTILTSFTDRISKNGNTLLNVGPRPDGSIPAEPKRMLKQTGDWLSTNAEAVYGSRPCWEIGEGPTNITSSGFEEATGVSFTPDDKRFLRNGDTYYVVLMDWPEGSKTTITTPLHRVVSDTNHKQPSIGRIDLLGGASGLDWYLAEQEKKEPFHPHPPEMLHVELPHKPGDIRRPYVLRVSVTDN